MSSDLLEVSEWDNCLSDENHGMLYWMGIDQDCNHGIEG